jgi:hypothetical protein
MVPTLDREHLIFREEGIELGDWKYDYKVSLDVPMSKVSSVLRALTR